MITAKWCNENLNASQVEWIHVKGEWDEVLEAVENRSLAEVKDELSDVLYFLYCWLQGKFGINLPMLGAMNSVGKIMNRLEVWKMIFVREGLVFDKKYLVNGSNYEREVKVRLALELARADERKQLHR